LKGLGILAAEQAQRRAKDWTTADCVRCPQKLIRWPR
jgi:hypothetical protein